MGPHADSFNEEEGKVQYILSQTTRPIRSIMTLQQNLVNIRESFDDATLLEHFIKLTQTSAKKPRVSHKQLSRRWGIGLETAAKTVPEECVMFRDI